MRRNILFMELVGDIFGGGQRSLLDLVTGLDASRFAPVVVCGAPGSLVQRVQQLGVSAQVVPMPTLMQPWAAGCRAAVTALECLLRAEQIALIHANQPRVALYALRAARSLGIPVVFHARVADRGGLLGRWVDQLLASRCRMIIAISRAVAARFTSLRGHATLRVIPNGVDFAWCDAPVDRGSLRGQLRLSSEVPLIGMVGLLEPRKGHTVLLDALPQVLSRHPKSHVVIAGRNAVNHAGYGEALRRLVAQRGLECCVTFLGFQEDVRPVLAGLTVCVMPVVQPEGLGRVAIEAAAMRCPMIATPLGGLAEIIEDGATGLAVPPGDARALAEALVRLLDDAPLAARLAAAARQKAERCFGLEMMRRQIQSVYEEVLAG